ncbi:hypothetical protein ACFC6L_32155 [Kitasatospora phosalacinea]|uniref:hypothetical protein n=1 Tax=Kitasatospora phosalacinea TaxID=2065 RepID=UPI0035E2E6F9
MRHPRSRTLAASAALTALAFGAFTTPTASAADSTLTIEAPSAVAVNPDSSAPGEGNGGYTNVQLNFKLSDHPNAATGRVTIDLAPLQGIASVYTPYGCSVAGQLLTCDAMSMYGGQQGMSLALYGPAAPGAPGSSAVLRTTAVFDGVTATADTKVTLGGSNLVVEDVPVNEGLKPGDTWTPKLRITNKGQLPASQLYLVFDGGMELTFLPQFSNCQYATDGDVQICTVHTAVQPGETVELSPIGFKVDSDAYYPYEDVSVSSAAPDATSWYSRFHYVPGPASAGKLTVVGKPDDSTTPNGVTDFEYENTISLTAKVPNTADFAATGSWAPEAGKQQGKLTVGMVNNGPASIDWRSGSLPARVRVELPAQAGVLQKPDNCYRASTDPAVNTFDCTTTPYIKNGYRASFDFTVRADPAAKLSAVVTLPSLGEDNQESGKPWDHDKSNDVVTVALGGEASTGTPSPQPSPSTGTEPGGSDPSASPSPAPGASSAAPSASPSASTGTGTGGTGGSTGGTGGTGNLASTGGGQGAGTVAGLGLGAVALGGGVLLVARRRKADAQQ